MESFLITAIFIIQQLRMNYCWHSHGFNLYHTGQLVNGLYRDCLYYHAPEQGLAYQLIKYCISSELDDDIINNLNGDRVFSFEDLQQQNVTSEQLYEWAAPIEIIEQYEMYLQNNSKPNSIQFYNCTFPHFGSRCEYSFSEPEISFALHVERRFAGDILDKAPVIFPCYTHLNCNRAGVDKGQTAGACLDWREICDGKVDCIDNKQDEEQCWQLEMNECDNATEFRCRNGLCIPLDFMNDDKRNPDCVDRSDEEPYLESPAQNLLGSERSCARNPMFRCEEHSCRQSKNNKMRIECGDGTCAELFYQDCRNYRHQLLISAYLEGIKASNACRQAIGCLTGIKRTADEKNHGCKLTLISTYINQTMENCPQLIEFPPMLFGHVYFIYSNDQSQKNFSFSTLHNWIVLPDYICYNAELCGIQFLSEKQHHKFSLNNSTTNCRPLDEYNILSNNTIVWSLFMNYLYNLFHRCSSYHSLPPMLAHSNLYQCVNTPKVISAHRILDSIQDCLYGDDESFDNSCSLNFNNHRFKCAVNNKTVCLAHICVRDRFADCDDRLDEEIPSVEDSTKIIAFPTICDGFTELTAITIDGRNETDETECEYFPCNNTYTRCDGYWNCPDGADEVNCESPATCPSLHHLCLSPETGNLSCLHIDRVNDGIIDCLGAIDERRYCRGFCEESLCPSYRCWNSDECISGLDICSTTYPCSTSSNITLHFCKHVNPSSFIMTCIMKNRRNLVEQILCTLDGLGKPIFKYLSLIIPTTLYPLTISDSGGNKPNNTSLINPFITQPANNNASMSYSQMASYCHRGIAVYRATYSSSMTKLTCLCPPAYHGRWCEIQTQRVSLTVQIQLSSDWKTIFGAVVTLIDDEQGIIESHDQFNYLSIRDCQQKYNIYLLYATRPKDALKNYTVRIDLYDKTSLEYRASWSYPVRFPFLPVHRMAVQLRVPPSKTILYSKGQHSCGNHGRLLKYVNRNSTFCLCHKGWSGSKCHIQHQCSCSPTSLCLGSSICLCPQGKLATRCYLSRPQCPCKNGGICAWYDEFINAEHRFWCMCPEGFSGRTCEISDTEIAISFAPDVSIPNSMLLHFIEVIARSKPEIHRTIFKKIAIDQDTIQVHTSSPFHILFVEVESKTYYLGLLEPNYYPAMNYSAKLTASNRCLSINELFNSTIVRRHLIRRIKLYHIPCQQRTDLACFYDETHMCVCNRDLRHANCFKFNHNMTYNCTGRSICENQGRCFIDKPYCPSLSTCVCDECSYGSRCQFSTRGFALSLDIILGYQIRPNASFTQQRASIKITTAIVSTMFVIGITSSIISIMTFQTKKTRQFGCGYYLLVSSYASAIVFIIFALKFYFLILSQIKLITNRECILVICILAEFITKVLVSISDWLNACVGVERAIVACQDYNVDRRKIKRCAKWIIISICVFTIATHLQDPIYRRLIDDEEEQRTWCITQYPSSIQIFNSIILLLHFLAPFILNIASALIIIFKVAHHRSTAQQQLSYREQLRQQFYRFKHLLISPMILILLALPRLVIAFISGCMKSPRNPWLFLVGYFISFVPPMLIFAVFVIPSKIYQTEFNGTVRRLTRYFPSQRRQVTTSL